MMPSDKESKESKPEMSDEDSDPLRVIGALRRKRGVYKRKVTNYLKKTERVK